MGRVKYTSNHSSVSSDLKEAWRRVRKEGFSSVLSALPAVLSSSLCVERGVRCSVDDGLFVSFVIVLIGVYPYVLRVEEVSFILHWLLFWGWRAIMLYINRRDYE